MKVSRLWLQSFFEQPLPATAELDKLFTFHSFEIDGTEQVGDDTIFEVKVLANRAHDCLSHRGLARELAAVLKVSRPATRTFAKVEVGPPAGGVKNQEVVNILDDRCTRYLAQVLENVTVGESPEWLKNRLASIGQRSINAAVDAANFVMFDIGQPLHVFDADKVKGKIRVRGAEKEESIITLDDKEMFLEQGMLVIADELGPLAIAGIKGGKRAAVDQNTKNIIIEAANFKASDVRQTATKLGLRTDALKRFENGLVPELAAEGLVEVASLLVELCGGPETICGEVVDIYPIKREIKTVAFTVAEINKILGLNIAEDEVVEILNNLGITIAKNGEQLVATSPIERRDLEGVEDIAEEVGRIYGYEHLPSAPLADFSHDRKNAAEFDYVNKLREVLVSLGFAEGYGYVFSEKGEMEVLKAIASDKAFLRTNLLDGLKDKIALNLKNILFDNEAVRLAVIGKVFTGGAEKLRLGLAYVYRAKKKDFATEIDQVISKFFAGLGVKLNAAESLAASGLVVNRIDGANEFYLELDVETLMKLPQESAPVNLDKFITNHKYKTISAYPWIVRDVAVWTPPEVPPVKVAEVIEHNMGELCVRGPILFDLFEKKDATGRVERKSIAFRLVFQAYDRTLSIEEVNKIVDNIIAILETHDGFEVRK